jgi:hypothetical protein
MSHATPIPTLSAEEQALTQELLVKVLQKPCALKGGMRTTNNKHGRTRTRTKRQRHTRKRGGGVTLNRLRNNELLCLLSKWWTYLLTLSKKCKKNGILDSFGAYRTVLKVIKYGSRMLPYLLATGVAVSNFSTIVGYTTTMQSVDATFEQAQSDLASLFQLPPTQSPWEYLTMAFWTLAWVGNESVALIALVGKIQGTAEFTQDTLMKLANRLTVLLGTKADINTMKTHLKKIDKLMKEIKEYPELLKLVCEKPNQEPAPVPEHVMKSPSQLLRSHKSLSSSGRRYLSPEGRGP